MTTRPHRLALAASLALAGTLPAQAQVYGSLANFDAVNDTGYVAHGFEIQIEDPAYANAGALQSIFGYDRNFGVPPNSVERYGAPDILITPGVGVTIRYHASFTNGIWSVGTPSGPYPNAGDSCWPFGNPLYASGTLTCDHFGVGTFGTPARTNYNWLVDTAGNSGVLTPMAAGVAPVNFFYNPAPPPVNGVAQAPELRAEVEAHKEADQAFGNAYWVKIFAKHVDHRVELDNLMHKNADVPGDQEVEAEFALWQAGGENEVSKALLKINPNDQALVLRFEFYKYQGNLVGGEAKCSGKGGVKGSPENCGGLGNYVGAQMAGFNLVQDPLAPGVLAPAQMVPEPATWALALAGLGALRLRRNAARREA
jgi:hypothetical protein